MRVSMKFRSTTLCSLAVALAACKGSPAQPPDAPAVADAPMADAPMIDAAVADAAPIDAQPDAPADAGIDANYAFDARADAQLDPVLSGIFAEVDGARIVTS